MENTDGLTPILTTIHISNRRLRTIVMIGKMIAYRRAKINKCSPTIISRWNHAQLSFVSSNTMYFKGFKGVHANERFHQNLSVNHTGNSNISLYYFLGCNWGKILKDFDPGVLSRILKVFTNIIVCVMIDRPFFLNSWPAPWFQSIA